MSMVASLAPTSAGVARTPTLQVSLDGPPFAVRNWVWACVGPANGSWAVASDGTGSRSQKHVNGSIAIHPVAFAVCWSLDTPVEFDALIPFMSVWVYNSNG